MRARFLAVTTVAALTLGLAGPAIAADSPGKPAFPPASDIPASLGNYRTAPDVESDSFSGRWYVCGNLRAKAGIGIAEATYSPTPDNSAGVTATARVYASPAKARAAYRAIAASVDSCAGTRTQESEPGSGQKWRTTTTTGTLPGGDLYVYDVQRPIGKLSLPWGAGYQVLSLSGDTILVTRAGLAEKATMTARQRAAVATFAADVDKTWTAARS